MTGTGRAGGITSYLGRAHHNRLGIARQHGATSYDSSMRNRADSLCTTKRREAVACI